MSERPRVLVTGGAGFIGSHVADAYLARGWEVWALDDLSTGRLENVSPDVHFREMDVAHPGVRDLLREVRFDVVNHHAAQIDVRISVADPAKDAGINLLGLLNLTEGALETGVRRFIYVSSGGVVYGEPDARPTPEAATKLPLSPYGVSKLAGEYYLNYYRRVRGLEYVALRYGNVYGPRQDPHGEAGVVAIFSERLLRGEPLTIFGDGEQTRDYVFVGDVARANLAATELVLDGAAQGADGAGADDAGADGAGLDQRAFNVGTGTGTSVNRLAELLEAVAGVRPGRERQDARPGELRHSALDVTRFARRGWSPATTLEDGLEATYHHIARTSGMREKDGEALEGESPS